MGRGCIFLRFEVVFSKSHEIVAFCRMRARKHNGSNHGREVVPSRDDSSTGVWTLLLLCSRLEETMV